MRKIVVEFTVPDEYEEDYKDVCAELIIEDFLGHEYSMRILSDVITTENKTKILVKSI